MSAASEISSDFIKIQDRLYGTRFYKADLHFHTPSSSDGRGKDKYGFNPYGIDYLEQEKKDPDLLAVIKGLDSLKLLKDRVDIRGLELEVLEVLERKVLHDMDLLQDIKSLKAGGNPARRSELGYKVLQGVKSLEDLPAVGVTGLGIFQCDDIRSLLGLQSREDQLILDWIAAHKFTGDRDLEGKFYDLRLLRDLKYMQAQVPVEGYPRTEREFRERLMRYAQLKARQIVERFREQQLDLVAVTDHNGFGTLWSDGDCMDLAAPSWYEVIDDAAREMNREKNSSLLILPGVEISTDGVHVLAVFPPQSPRRKAHFMICELVEEAGIRMEEWCKNDAVGNITPYGTINLIHERGGIAIPAHIDAAEKGLLEMYKLTVGALEDVVANPHLRAVEVVSADLFREGETKNRLEEVRRRNDLPSLAYFQGSDSHDLLHIAKRSTALKMTAPSFDGLQAAIKMPASRVRFSDDRKEWDGLYLRGMVFEHPFLGTQALRFNRNLNCVSGEVGVGKTMLHNLMEASIDPEAEYPSYSDPAAGTPADKGYVTLFAEKIQDVENVYPPRTTTEYYAFHRKAGQPLVEIYNLKVDPRKDLPEKKLPEASLLAQIKVQGTPQESPSPHLLFSPEMFGDQEMGAYLDSIGLQPRCYHAEEMQRIIADLWVESLPGQAKVRDDSLLQHFLCKFFGSPTPDSVKAFNRIFFMPRFQEGNRDKILEDLKNKKRDLLKAQQELSKAQAAFDVSPKLKADKDALKKIASEKARLEQEIARARRSQLLEIGLDETSRPARYRLALNLNWRTGEPEMQDFFSINESQRRTVMVCMVIMCSRLPVIIDAPEEEFDNDDMTSYLVPLILENKEMRQILLFTNHPILAVNTDPENYLLLHRQEVTMKAGKAGAPRTKIAIESGFAIDAPSPQKELLLKVLEGDLRAFRKRAVQYE